MTWKEDLLACSGKGDRITIAKKRKGEGGTGQIPRDQPSGGIRWALRCHRDPGTGRGWSCRRLKGPTFGGGLRASPGPAFHLAPPGSAAASAARDGAWPGEALRRVLLPGTGAKGAPEAAPTPQGFYAKGSLSWKAPGYSRGLYLRLGTEKQHREQFQAHFIAHG